MLTFEDWPRIVAAPAILILIHFAESQFVTPAFVSRRCALNTVAVFVTIALLGWMWGAIGAIVAVAAADSPEHHRCASAVAAVAGSAAVGRPAGRPAVLGASATRFTGLQAHAGEVQAAALAATPGRGEIEKATDHNIEAADQRPRLGRIHAALEQGEARIGEAKQPDQAGQARSGAERHALRGVGRGGARRPHHRGQRQQADQTFDQVKSL